MNLANINRHVRLVAQGDVEAEGGQADQRLNRWPIDWRWVGHRYAGNLRGRPDAQAMSLSPHAPLPAQSVAEGDMEGVEFHAGMEVVGQTLDNAHAQIRFRAARSDDSGDCNCREQNEKRARGTQEPPVPACERSLLLCGSHF